MFIGLFDQRHIFPMDNYDFLTELVAPWLPLQMHGCPGLPKQKDTLVAAFSFVIGW